MAIRASLCLNLMCNRQMIGNGSKATMALRIEWPALEKANHENADAQRENEEADEVANDAETIDREDAPVEEEDRDLGNDEGGCVGEPTAEVALPSCQPDLRWS
ncbi:MAG: hypothetical protein Q9182_000313 [Xanthomendoza sp. 2 TL-2023]